MKRVFLHHPHKCCIPSFASFLVPHSPFSWFSDIQASSGSDQSFGVGRFSAHPVYGGEWNISWIEGFVSCPMIFFFLFTSQTKCSSHRNRWGVISR